MPHIRILRHYIHTPYIVLALGEMIVATTAAYLAYYTRYQQLPDVLFYLPTALTFSLIVVVANVAMGVYEARLREGFSAMMLRTAVAIFLLGTILMGLVSYFVPLLEMARPVLLFATLETFLLIGTFRWITSTLIDEDKLKKRVLVLGTGRRAQKIAARMRRRSDQRGFILLGFMQGPNAAAENQVSEHQAEILSTNLKLSEYCARHQVEEIVVAMDEQRRSRDAAGGLPLEELMDCRLSGVNICDVQQFIERESGKVDIDLLRPSWMVYADGFKISTPRAAVKRTFDLLASISLLLLAWPVMLLAALCIKLESGFSTAAVFRQVRVGLDGTTFSLLKFRSMHTSDPDDSAMWTRTNDKRVTRVGSFIRKTRIDELPQLFNVIRGEMSFVGPRPERPTFVDEFNESIPFYRERHRVKPGITGWAQLCYPYGDSVDDAREKLQYDLYYLKNQSILLDLAILIQTVEVVLIGEGAR